MVDTHLFILFLSDTVSGKVHDKRLADEYAYPLPESSELLQDLGFQGYHLEGVCITMPTKKPRGQELSLEQKAINTKISRSRVRIEHVNSSIKRCRIIQDTCRLYYAETRDMVMEIACGLHNFRLSIKPWVNMT